jgi:3-oxoacyl-[acyl-carrier protein] reductase
MTDLTGRVALVTGSSRGIGRAAALALADAGAHVAVNYRKREDEARKTMEQILGRGRRAVIVRADVSSAQAVSGAVEKTEEELGAIDILVNNAGIATKRTVEEITEQDWDETLTVNLKSTFLLTQAVVPGMRKQRWGRIINISSGAAYNGGIIGPHYTASKAGMEGLTRAYALRLAKDGITVNSIAPSLIETDMLPGDPELARLVPVGRMGQAAEVAQAVVFVAGNAYMTGQTVFLNGGRYFH